MTKIQVFFIGVSAGVFLGVVLMAAIEIRWPLFRKGGKY
jgi:hypothetical protein